MKPGYNFFVIAALVTILFFSNSLVQADIYKWVDEDGNTVYSQSPPTSDVEYERVSSPSKVDSARALKDLRDDKIKADKLRRERLSKDAERKKAQEAIALQEENCEIAQGKLASLQRPRAKILQPDGSRIRLNEEERQRQIKEAEAKIQEWCTE